MALITDWVRNIIILVLVTAFLMIFLPENNLRKYVRVIMGFFIITVFIAPISGFFRGDGGFIYDSIIHSGEEWMTLAAVEVEGEKLEDAAGEAIAEHYEREISRELKKLMEINFPDRENRVEVALDEHFNLKKVQVELGRTDDEISIDPVEIDFNSESGEEKLFEQPLYQEKRRIENKISNIFQIPATVVEVKLEGLEEE